MGQIFSCVPRSRLSTSEILLYGKIFVSYERKVTFRTIFVRTRDLPGGNRIRIKAQQSAFTKAIETKVLIK